MTGYSGTALPKKLGIKPGFRAYLVKVPPQVRSELGSELAACTIAPNLKTPVDFALLLATSRKQLAREFIRVARALAPAGMLWVGWPKKLSKVPSDLDENRVREIGLAEGLVDVKVCAISEIWSGLKFVRRVKDRKKVQKK
jgi:hypothetical protein